jgi:ABC-2 type transport system ATP-binding protein
MIIETHDLAKRYRKVDAVNGLNVSVEEGSAFALIGPNGAGKTTLIKLLVNILQPSAGSASVLGVDSRRISHGELARIGYVAENQELPGRLTVAEYFDYLRPFYSQWDKNLEDDIRRRMELPGERRIRDLSHGMRMKMTLACALPFRPELLVLDEPLSGLDPLVRDEIIEGVLSHAGETTILISSHELVEIENVVTHVAFLEDGKLLFQEATDDLYGRIKEIRVTLESRAALPAIPPQGWIEARISGNVLTFVDTQYSETTLGARVRAQLPGVRQIEAEPLPLRAIFTALARDSRAKSRERSSLPQEASGESRAELAPTRKRGR